MKLELQLLSDSMAGSGEGIAGIIDSDVQYDEYGIPYIPAKRIKGILRESAVELEDIGMIKQSSIEDIFGKSGSSHDAPFKIGNGYYKNYPRLREFCHYAESTRDLTPIFSASAILSYFTYLRTQTSLEDGVAKEDTLRTLRILRKGLSFFFEITFPIQYKSDILNICRITRHFGISRTRGLGEIRITLIEDEACPSQEKKKELEIQSDSNLSAHNYALKYSIENFQSLLVCLTIGREVFSEDYIPGSAILGAFATAFLKKYPLVEPVKDTRFRNFFLNGTVKFLNAYFSGKDYGRFFPLPASIVEIKDTKESLDLAHPESLAKVCQEELQVQKLHGYVNQGLTQKTSPIIKMEYHHSRPPDNRTIGHASEQYGGEFFQYEAISPNQNFQGLILGPGESLKDLQNLIANECDWYLGKSRTAQYGQVRLTYEACEVFSGELAELSIPDNVWESQTTITIVFTSPMILINSCGFPETSPSIFVEELTTKTNNSSIQLEKSFLKFTTIGGFMNKWGLPKPQSIALDAGSTLVLKNTSNSSIPLSQLIQNSYGIRTEEGLGRIAVYMPQERLFLENFRESNHWAPSADELSPLHGIICHILQRNLEVFVKQIAIKKGENNLKVLSGSFINRLKAIIENSQDFDDLQNKLGLLKKNAIEKLGKLRDMFYLLIHNNPLRIEINQNAFGEILGASEQNNSPRIRNLLKLIAIPEDWYSTSKYFYYTLYVSTYLNLLKWHNREKKL